MAAPVYTVRPLDDSTWPAFAALVEHNNGIFGGCWCMGWCQFGPPAELSRIKGRAACEKGQTGSPDWRIGCCCTGKAHRREGVGTAALDGALELIARCRPTGSSDSPCNARSASTAGS